MRYAPETLDYSKLISESRNLDVSHCQRTARVAILADCATQHFTVLLRVLAARNGINLEIYEGHYDGVDLEILNPQSHLYEFNPQYLLVIYASEKLKTKFYESADRLNFAEKAIDRIENLWRVFQSHSKATIIQGTYVLPNERAFGNYELKVAESLGATFTEINYQIAKKARAAKNVLLCDLDFLAASVGRQNWFDPRMWNLAKSPCAAEHLPRLAQTFVDVLLSAIGLFTKVVVLDLDNTMWGGVIGDDGLEGIGLGEFDEGEAFVGWQRFIKELKRRGIVLAVVSKNEHANAMLPFREHPHMVLKEADISVFVANWDNKADNIRLIQKTLNLGFDSFVFLDDNPFERNIVREFLPDVVVPELPEDPSYYLQSLADQNLFETASFSEADRSRADQYREEAQRELTKTHFTNVNEYLGSLDMKIKLERFNKFNLPRIAQLMQRSNQFNLLTRRYSEAACEAMTTDARIAPFTLTLADKFGDYGLISVIILKLAGEIVEIDEYLMSCRVLQRGVEHFAMDNIFAFAKRNKAKAVVGRYQKTAKNDMVRDFYKTFGFEKTADDGAGTTEWTLAVDAYKPREIFMTPTINEL